MGEKWARLETVVRDVKLVKENAVRIFKIHKDGSIDIIDNENFRLEVVAVIGPYKDEKWDLEEALLLEVGLNRTRPYNECNIPPSLRKEGEPRNFTIRYHGLHLTPEQYQLVAPHIFEYLESRAAAQVSSRKDGWQPYKVKALGKHNSSDHLHKPFLGRRGKLVTAKLKYEVPPLVRFSARMTDRLFVSDIYWAELFGNQKVQDQLKGLGNEIQTLLDTALKKTQTTPKDWRKNKLFNLAMIKFDRFTISYGDSLGRDRSYLQKILLRDHVGERHYFFDEIATRLAWVWDEPIKEEQSALQALPDPELRLNGIQIKVWRIIKNQLTFDVFPRKSEDEEEIPF